MALRLKAFTEEQYRAYLELQYEQVMGAAEREKSDKAKCVETVVA
jgi:hypothetical protein